LVVDDKPEMLKLMGEALGEAFECEFADDIAQAHEKLTRGDFELVICNLDAKGKVGLGLAKEIIETYPDTATVVLMTGDDDPGAARQAFASGVYGYLVEPFLPGQLLITVMSALRRRELEVLARAHSQNLEDKHQKIIDMAPMPIYAKDASHRYVVANAKAEELAGIPPGELLGKSDEAIMPKADADLTALIDSRVIDEGFDYEADEDIVVGGVERRFKTVKFPLLDEAGTINAVGGISVDVTAENEANRLRDELAKSQQTAIDELQLSRQETIEGLARAINLHDASTGDHVDRMAPIAAFLGERLKLDPEHIRLLRAAAPMHDVGKIGVPAEILRKAGPLTAAERAELEKHTLIGHKIFAGFDSRLSKVAASIALTHHERFDGGGYPHGLEGEQIPIEGRITAVADVFDALLSDRAYRKALPLQEAVAIMRAGSGSHFDPDVVRIVLDELERTLALRAESTVRVLG
jgi:PAS domain S-box-containing protein